MRHIRRTRTKREEKKPKQQQNQYSACCFDLEKVLINPHSEVSNFYFSRKLATYNFSLCDLGTKDDSYYMWREAIAQRGFRENATCVEDYLSQQIEKGIKRIVLFSDSCAEQNRNKHVVTMNVKAMQNITWRKLNTVFLKFVTLRMRMKVSTV